MSLIVMTTILSKTLVFITKSESSDMLCLQYTLVSFIKNGSKIKTFFNIYILLWYPLINKDLQLAIKIPITNQDK